jgi:thioredoxin 1
MQGEDMMVENLTKSDFLSKVFNFEKNGTWQYEGQLPAIVEFWAEWCGPCKMISPILDEIASQYQGKINVFKVNTDEQPDVASVFNVMSIPSLLFIPLNDMPRLSVGALPKAGMMKLVREVLQVE